MNLSLAKIEEVRLALDAAITVQEVKGIRDAALAMHLYSEQQKVGKDIQQKIAGYVIMAEHKIGEFMVAAKEAGQITTQHHYSKNVIPAENNVFTLKEVGIDPKLSMRSQQLAAAIPKEELEKKIEELKEKKGTISTNALLQMCRDSKKQERVSKPRETPILDNAREIVKQKLEANQSTNSRKLEKEHGISHVMFEAAAAVERAVASVKPTITPDMLSMTAQQKLELAIKQHKQKLDAEFRLRVSAEIKELLARTIGPRHKREQEIAKREMNRRRGVMDKRTYTKIRACLHPDWVVDPAQKVRYEEAFSLFTVMEKLLLNEKDSPTEWQSFPGGNAAEWDAWAPRK